LQVGDYIEINFSIHSLCYFRRFVTEKSVNALIKINLEKPRVHVVVQIIGVELGMLFFKHWP
jgi:hypothetical protein